MKDEDEGDTETAEEADQARIIGEAITAKLSKMFYHQIHDNDVSPGVIALALLTVAGNISAQHLGIKATVALFRICASDFEKKIPRRSH